MITHRASPMIESSGQLVPGRALSLYVTNSGYSIAVAGILYLGGKRDDSPRVPVTFLHRHETGKMTLLGDDGRNRIAAPTDGHEWRFC